MIISPLHKLSPLGSGGVAGGIHPVGVSETGVAAAVQTALANFRSSIAEGGAAGVVSSTIATFRPIISESGVATISSDAEITSGAEDIVDAMLTSDGLHYLSSSDELYYLQLTEQLN
jgi:hypothetical protein